MVVLAGNWWAFVLRGVLAILFGLLAFAMPGMALLTLVYLFGFYAIADGVFNLVAAFRRTPSPESQPWWALLIWGIVGIIAGLYALFAPGLTAIALLYVIAAWAIVTGIMAIAAAVRLRRHIRGEWLLALAGVFSIVFGVLLFLFPGAGALAVVLWIGAYATLFGATLIALGFKVRKWLRPGEEYPPHGRLAHGH